MEMGDHGVLGETPCVDEGFPIQKLAAVHFTMKLSIFFLLFTGLMSSVHGAVPDFLLIVNDADPAAVTFTATTNDSFIADSIHTFNAGITLTDFLTSADSGLVVSGTTSSLTTFLDGTPVFGMAVSNNLSGSFVDLNIYTASNVSGQGNTMNFAASSQALTGAAQFNLSSDAARLPANGTIGSLYAGYQGFRNAPVLIGNFMVVPEPSQLVWLVIGGMMYVLFRRTRSHPI